MDPDDGNVSGGGKMRDGIRKINTEENASENSGGQGSNRGPWIGLAVLGIGTVAYLVYDYNQDDAARAALEASLRGEIADRDTSFTQSFGVLTDKLMAFDTTKMDTANVEINGEVVPIWYSQGIMINRNTKAVGKITSDMEIYRTDIDGNTQRIDALVGNTESQMSVQQILVLAKEYTDEQIAKINEWNNTQQKYTLDLGERVNKGFKVSGIESQIEKYDTQQAKDSAKAAEQAEYMKTQIVFDYFNAYIDFYNDFAGLGFMRFKPDKLDNNEKGRESIEMMLSAYNENSGINLSFDDLRGNQDALKVLVVEYIDNQFRTDGERAKDKKKPGSGETFGVEGFAAELAGYTPKIVK